MTSVLARFGSVLADLRFFIPGMALLLVSLWSPVATWPWLVVLAQPLLAAAAVRLLGYDLDEGFFGLVFRRGPVMLLVLLCYALLVGVLVAWPIHALLQARTPMLAIALSGGLLMSIFAALRLWPMVGLSMVCDDAWFVDGRHVSPLRALHQVSAQALLATGKAGDQHFGSGVLVALALILLVLAGVAVSGVVHWLPSSLRAQAWGVFALGIAPVVHLLVIWRSAALLNDADESPQGLQRPLEFQSPTFADTTTIANDWDAPPPTPASADAAEPPTTQPERNLAMLTAVGAGNVAQALALLDAGADANVAPGPNDRDQRGALSIAATWSDLGLMRTLIAKGADPNLAVNGITPLHAATRDSLHGRADAVMTLLANGAIPDRVDHDGNAPLHHAALSEEPTIAAMLLDAGAATDPVNREGLTALAIAARAGNEAVLRLLLDRGAKIETARGVSALIAAVSGHEDRAAIIKRLIKAKADVAALDKLGRSALHAAALHGHGDCADALIAAGADVNARDAHGVTPLMEAARAGANRVLARLVFRKPDASPTDAQGRTALHLACASRQANLETVNTLLALGIDTQAATRDGRRAVDIASASGRWDMVAAIDPNANRPASLDAPDDVEDTTPAPGERERLLLESLRQGHTHIARELLSLEPPLATESLLRAFRIVLEHDDVDALHMLVAEGFDPVAAPLDDSEALQMAARLRPVPTRCMQALLGTGASAAGAGVLLPLLANAVDEEAGPRDALDTLALQLLDCGADCFARISGGAGALHLAMRGGLIGIARRLIERGLDVNAVDHHGQTALHLLMRLPRDGREALLVALIRAGADPERASADGETPLGRATLARRDDALRLLRWAPWRLPQRGLLDADLPTAARAGDRAAVGKLLELGLPVDATDAQGCTALLRASGGGFEGIVADLLEHGAGTNLRAGTGATALSAAVSAGHERIVAALVAHGVEIDQALAGGVTPLMIAAALGNDALVQSLLVRGASALAQDELGQTALHAAAQFAYNAEDAQAATRVIDRLLDAGCPIDAANRDGQTALLLLLGARADAGTRSSNRELGELISRLVHEGADVDVQDRRGISVLHAAAMHGMLDVAERLIKSGADPRRRDGVGRSANEVAILLGYVDLAAVLKRD